jgi:hypothetical protein
VENRQWIEAVIFQLATSQGIFSFFHCALTFGSSFDCQIHFRIAMHRGGGTLVFAVRFAPLSSRSEHVASLPMRAAKWSAVSPC